MSNEFVTQQFSGRYAIFVHICLEVCTFNTIKILEAKCRYNFYRNLAASFRFIHFRLSELSARFCAIPVQYLEVSTLAELDASSSAFNINEFRREIEQNSCFGPKFEYCLSGPLSPVNRFEVFIVLRSVKCGFNQLRVL